MLKTVFCIAKILQKAFKHPENKQKGYTEKKIAVGCAISKWEMEQSLPEIDKVVLMSKLFSVGTNELLLEDEDLKKLRPQEIHLGSIYLITRDFEKSIAFYEKLLSMTVSTRNCGNKFAEFFFDNKCLALMNENNLVGHHYEDGDYYFHIYDPDNNVCEVTGGYTNDIK